MSSDLEGEEGREGGAGPPVCMDRANDSAGKAATATLEHLEQVSALMRVRRVLFVGIALWTSGLGLDLLAARLLAPGALSELIALRLVGALLIAGTWLRFRTPPHPSPLAQRLWTTFAFTGAAAALSAMGTLTGGIRSPYFGGVMVVIVVHAAAAFDRWQRGAVDVAAPVLAWPVVHLVALESARGWATLFDEPAERAAFLFDITNLAIAYVAVVVGGHSLWSLRRQVFAQRSLGRYTLRKRIGSGGMGEVWVAHHAALKVDVAVKVLRSDWAAAGEAARLRFEREVRATTELTHPNTVRILDYGVTEDGLSYYAMELLHGEDLGALVAREGPLAPTRAVHLMLQAASALGEAHAKGIVHRDVKPENLFVTTLGGVADFVKVLDFGIAKLGVADDAPRLTHTGALVGTPAWASPEALAQKPVDARADVYAMGAVLYFLLTGAPPFESKNIAELVRAQLADAPPMSSRLGRPLAAHLEAIVTRCLAKDPADRFASATELMLALDACPESTRGAVVVNLAERSSKEPPLSTAERGLAPTHRD